MESIINSRRYFSRILTRKRHFAWTVREVHTVRTLFLKAPMSKRNMFIIGGLVALLAVWLVVQTMSGFMGRKMVESLIENSISGEADIDMKDDGTMDITTKKGTFSTGNSVPKEWPEDVPAYAGASVTYSASANQNEGKSGMALILATDDTAADVKSFYETTLQSKGWTLTNTLEGGGSVIITAEKDGRQLSLVISEADGKTGITLGVEASL